MKCDKCKRDFPESQLDESHDIPCYLFIYSGNRKNQKNQADKYGRKWLCKKCHKEYESQLNTHLKLTAKSFSKKYFKEVRNESVSKV